MPYEALADFLSELENGGELVRVRAAVEADLELAEIARQINGDESGGKAVLFEDVRGSDFPVVVDLLGSAARLLRALNAVSLEEIANRISGLLRPELPEGMLEALRLVPQFTNLAKIPPQTVKTGACQQVVKMGRDVNLSELPLPRCWPEDAAAAITAGQVFSRHPEHGLRDVSLTALQVRDARSLFVRFSPHDDLAAHWNAYRAEGRQMPLAVALGGDPVLLYAASAPLPRNVDACLFAGFLRGENVELVKCRSNELFVPAGCEFVIEGYIDTEAEYEEAGGIGLESGYYAAPRPLPVMHVTALTHRANPVLPAMVPDVGTSEGFWIGTAHLAIFQPLVKIMVPEIVDVHVPRSGVPRSNGRVSELFVSIRKGYPLQARKVVQALWGMGREALAKTVVVVDDDCDVTDEAEVRLRIGANCHPVRDVFFGDGPAHVDDHAAPVPGVGSRMGIDATRKTPEEGHSRDWPERLAPDEAIRARVTRRWSEYGLDGAGSS